MATQQFKIRPYARLLTMLGEQLIKNEQIALTELIKNSYDADADWVSVNFEDFEYNAKNKKLKDKPDSKIIIEDNGSGMSLDIIQNSWMNPATPNKKKIDTNKTLKGRIVQGEKGIGRFAILKLGRDVRVITRPKNSDFEYIINYNFSKYDDDFLTENGEDKQLYIDDLNIEVVSRKPTHFIERSFAVDDNKLKDNDHGTRIEISNLKSSWNYSKLNNVYKESQKLESIIDKIFGRKVENPFNIYFEVNSERNFGYNDIIDKLSNLINGSSVLRITEGIYDEKNSLFKYKINDDPYIISLSDPYISGLNVFRECFVENNLFGNGIRKSECGNFKFNFFIFDFNAKNDSRYFLDKEDKECIKEHRIYLYRDGIRVAPYGDPDNDWLETDKKRGTGRAGDYLSNDQVVGFVDISKNDNPKLKDKTNREGLIETGNATRDFIILLHTFLLYVRQHPYMQYQEKLKKKKEQEDRKKCVVRNKFKDLEATLSGNKDAIKIYKDVVRAYDIENEYYTKSLNITEELAGVGLSVETASHDLMLMLSKSVDFIKILKKKTEQNNKYSEIVEDVNNIEEAIQFVYSQMRDVQLLFKSSKQKKKKIKISDLLTKVVKIYNRTLLRNQISLEIKNEGVPLVVECTDAVILQLLINLFDNAVYWLSTPNYDNRKIKIVLNGDSKQIVFSDNGPGIKEDDIPYIFEAFYSGKEQGRGLGLYIARQLLMRMDASIDILNIESKKILSGANFIVDFK